LDRVSQLKGTLFWFLGPFDLNVKMPFSTLQKKKNQGTPSRTSAELYSDDGFTSIAQSYKSLFPKNKEI